MRYRAAVALALVLSLSLIPALQVGPAKAQSGYSERLDVYTAGSSALWFLTFHGINATGSSLASAESVQGVTSYSLTAMKASGASPDYQVFGTDGYGILKFPFLPLEGAFLSVNATSASAADAAASAFDAYLAAAFVPVSSGAGTFTYFSSVDFAGVAVPTMFGLVPASMNGMASMVSESSFLGASLPLMTLAGVRTGGSFVHTLRVGGAATTVFDSNGYLAMSRLLVGANSTVQTSPASSSSLVVVHSLDGLVSSSDQATKANHPGNFSGTYSLRVTPGKKAKANVTVIDQVPHIEAYRTVDRGIVAAGDVLSVTMLVRQTSTSGVVQNVQANDTWWQNYPNLFQLSGNSSSLKIPSLGPGQNASQTYVLKVLAGTGDVVLPPLMVRYSFSQQGEVFSASTTTNQAEVQVGQGQHGPALSVLAHSSLRSGSPVGADGHFAVSVTNMGDSPALNLRIANYTTQSLAPGGNSWNVEVPISSAGLLDTNISRSFLLQWNTPSGQSESMTSNQVSLLLSHSGMNIPFVFAVANATLTPGALASGSLNATYTFENRSTVNASAADVSLSLPASLVCTKVESGPGTCNRSSFSASVRSLSALKPSVSVLSLAIGRDDYVLRPANVSVSYRGMTLHGWGSPLAIPAGVVLSKSFGPDHVFPGMSSTVTLALSNQGSLPLFNLTLSSAADSFDNVASASNAQKTFATVGPRQSVNFTYQVSVSTGGSGNQTATPAQGNLLFGGTRQSLESGKTNVVIFKPVFASVEATPSAPVEGTAFDLKVVVTNPASVPISDVVLKIPLPSGLQVLGSSGLQVLGGSLLVSAGSISAGANYTASATLKATLGQSFDMRGSVLTFQYGGVNVKGTSIQKTLTISEDVTARYTFPIAIAILILLAEVVYVRRRALGRSL